MNTLFYSFTIGILLSIILIFLIYFLKKINKTQLQQIFSCNMILLITTCIFLFLQMQLSNSLNIEPIYFSYFYYIGIILFPISLLFTVLIFTNTKIKFKPKHLFLFIIPIICLLGLWTNNITHLFFKNYDLNLNNCTFGPLFILNEIYSYIIYIIAIIKLIKYLKEHSKPLNLFIIGISFPLLLNLLGIFKIIDFTVYVTPIALSISLICFTLALFKYQLLDALPIALNKIVNRISDGYIVLNEKNIITDYNIPFLEIFKIKNKKINYIHIFDLISLKNFDEITENTIINAIQSVKTSNETLVIELEFKNIQKFLRLEINSIRSDSMFIGTLILVKDITEHHKDLETIKSNQSILIEKERLASLGQMISRSCT